MRVIFSTIAIISCLFVHAQKPVKFMSFGIDFRDYPIDVEDVQQGPLPSDNGLPSDDTKFWKVWSINGKFGFIEKKNWLLSASIYTRYNLLHRKEAVNYYRSPQNPTVLAWQKPLKPKTKNNIKLDFFIDLEKKFRLRENKKRYLFTTVGIGYTNINSKFDVILIDSLESIPDSHHYRGTHLHFGPRFNFGYQYEKIKISLGAFVIEDPIRANLTSLWFNGAISYEIVIRKRKKQNVIQREGEFANAE